MRILAIALAALLAPAILAGTTYEVGNGKTYSSISGVPWHTLAAGDTVLIYYRATPYKEKWVICRQGQAGAPITVRGVPDPSTGALPVIDGNGASTFAPLNYWNEERSLIKIGGANTPADTTPQYIVIENLDLQSARPPYTFTDDAGVSGVPYIDNAAAIYIEKGQHITVRNCKMHDCGNGLFVASSSGVTQDILIEGNYIYDNGNVGSIYEHNNYSECTGITFQYNRFGPLRAGCGGNNLKDRSAGTVVRYNWIQGGNRALDLVDSDTLYTLPSYSSTFVYGNVLLELDDTGNSQVIHYGGDGDPTHYRKGTLYLYNNTIHSSRPGNTTLVRCSTSSETVDMRNNIYYGTAAGTSLAITADTGTVNLRNNWLKTGWRNTHSPGGTVNDLGGNVVGSSPGFVDEPNQDFHIASSSTCKDAATTQAAATSPTQNLIMEYLKHQRSVSRGSEGALDIGAYEFLTNPDPPPPPGAPAAPSGLIAVGVSASQINLTWTDNASDETSYSVERSSNGTTAWTSIVSLGANAASYSNTGLSAATTYFYRVQAVNAAGGSAYSPSASATTSSGGGGGSSPTDTDGDGVDDATEATLGTNPNDPNSKPGGTADFDGDGIPDDLDGDADGDGVSSAHELADGTNPFDAGSMTKTPMTVMKLQAFLKFTLTEKDAASASFILPAQPALLDTTGKTITVNIGGASETVTLDAKGKGKSDRASVALKLKPSKRNSATKKVEFQGGDVSGSAKLKGGTWSDDWAGEGATNSDEKNKAVPVVVDVTFNGKVYTATVSTLYTAKAGKTGKFKK